MGWKSTMRSIEAAQRRSEREALRRERELDSYKPGMKDKMLGRVDSK